MLLLTGDQLKEYLIERITFWLGEHLDTVKRSADVGEYEWVNGNQNGFEEVYQKLFGAEEFRKVYQEIYDKVYKKEI